MLKVLNIALVPFCILALCLVNWKEGGAAQTLAGFKSTWGISLKYLMPIALIFLLMGQAEVLMNQHLELVKVWLTGGKGITAAWVAALISPGGGLTASPILRSLWDQSIGRDAVIMFLVSAALVNWQTLMFRQAILGWSITLYLFLAGLMASLFTGIFLYTIQRFWR